MCMSQFDPSILASAPSWAICRHSASVYTSSQKNSGTNTFATRIASRERRSFVSAICRRVCSAASPSAFAVRPIMSERQRQVFCCLTKMRPCLSTSYDCSCAIILQKRAISSQTSVFYQHSSSRPPASLRLFSTLCKRHERRPAALSTTRSTRSHLQSSTASNRNSLVAGLQRRYGFLVARSSDGASSRVCRAVRATPLRYARRLGIRSTAADSTTALCAAKQECKRRRRRR